MPFVGEAADAYKTAKLGAKIADKASDIYKASKTVDRIVDFAKSSKVCKFANCLNDGIITATVYNSQGKSFAAGFSNGIVSSIVSTYGFGDKSATTTVIGNTIGSALGMLTEEILINKNTLDKNTVESIALSAVSGIVSGLGTASTKHFITMANDANSVAQELTKYDKQFGKALELFFNKLITVMSAIDYEDKENEN